MLQNGDNNGTEEMGLVTPTPGLVSRPGRIGLEFALSTAVS